MLPTAKQHDVLSTRGWATYKETMGDTYAASSVQGVGAIYNILSFDSVCVVRVQCDGPRPPLGREVPIYLFDSYSDALTAVTNEVVADIELNTH